MTGRDLGEAILQLQKLHLEPGVGPVVEEAAELFALGRDLEAGALVEKAEAIMAGSAAEAPQPFGQDDPSGSSNARNGQVAEEESAARLADSLARALARTLVTAIQELQQHVTDESHRLSDSFRRQMEGLQFTVESWMPLKEKIEQLTQAVSEQRAAGLAAQEKYEQLTAAVKTLQEADARHEAEVRVLRGETRELSVSVSDRIDVLSSRLWLQQEELSGLRSMVSEVSPRVAALVERLDRHADAIRSVYESHARRDAVLEQLAAVLSQLKAATLPPPADTEDPL